MIKTSYELLNHPFALGTPYYDQIYLSAILQQTNESYLFQILKDDAPAVRMNKNVNIHLPTVAEMKNSDKYVLLSANVMFFMEGLGYPVLLRDEGAPAYPLHYTCPAGRCDHSPQKTALAELNQEIALFIQNSATREICIAGFGSEVDANEGKCHKEHCMQSTLPKVVSIPLHWKKNRHLYRLETNEGLIEEGTATIINDGNVYELCFEISASLPKGWEFHSVLDGDGYGRKVSFIQTLSALKSLPCVPALEHFMNSMFQDNVK